MSDTTEHVDQAVLDPTRDAFGAEATVGALGRTHFIGIGGAGMSVLAEMLHAQGVEVDGSDREDGAKTRRLRDLGIPVEIGQRADNVRDADTVVYSSAIKPDNPEIVAALERGCALVHRSDILALLMHGRRAVTVAGAHGKTTTSSMIAHILVHAGTGPLADPSYAIGGSVQGADGTTLDGGHAGAGSVIVAEADESDGSFGKYRPQIAVITNAEPDHLDHYGDAAHYHRAFVDYASHATGRLVVCADDEGARDVLRALDPEVASRAVVCSTEPEGRYELPDVGAYVRISSESETAGSGVERFALDLSRLGEGLPADLPVALAVPGIHNARNASEAIVATTLLGMDPRSAAGALSDFLGASRRFQIRGTVKQVTVVDDYAHHPTEIAALLRAGRRRYPDRTIRVLFQPHLFSRTAFFARQFAEALALADDVIVTGVFPARERQEDWPGVSARTIVDAARDVPHVPSEGWIQAVDDMHLAATMMAMRAHHGDVVFTVGAGDVTEAGPVLLHALEAHREGCDS